MPKKDCDGRQPSRNRTGSSANAVCTIHQGNSVWAVIQSPPLRNESLRY
jgi:hypothetical protein